jgi:Holliday junction resolvasome RuvABC endonuclease subunit
MELKMSVLALDLGTTTGFAASGKGGHNPIITGTWLFKPSRFEGGGMRYLRFRRQLDELHAASKVEFVVFEEVRRHSGTGAAHVYGGLMGTLTAWCEENGVPYEGQPVGTIKKYATGRGNANKDDMLAAVRSWGYEPADDNEADAIALLHLTLTENYGIYPNP